MSERLRRFAPYLRLLHKAKPSVRKSMLKSQCDNKDFIHCICECAKNLLKGNVPLSSTQKGQLFRRKKLRRKLVLKKTSLKDKKKIVQRGGFLSALLAPLIKIIGGLFAGS
jgi:hypothetical protein